MSKIETLGGLSLEFEKWRRNKSGKKHIPDRLWKSVAELPAEYSIHEITKTLRLDWKRVKELRSDVALESGSDRRELFVEVSPAIVNSVSEVVFERADGCRMRVEVSPGEEIHDFVRLFFEKGQ